MGSTQPASQKTNFDICQLPNELQNRQKSAVTHPIEKPILINFMNLSTILCPRLSEETHSHF